jgi:agmatinase
MSGGPGASPSFLDLHGPGDPPARAPFAVIPVPYDGTSTWRKGADRGPAALLDASAECETYDAESGVDLAEVGVATLPPIEHDGSPDALAALVARATGEQWGAGRVPCVVGGEHSVSIGAIQEAARRFEDLAVLQIDAHGDTRDTYHGSAYNHACVMARAMEVAPVVQVGLRSVAAEEMAKIDRGRAFFAHEIVGALDRDWMDRVVGLLETSVYVTIDLDAFDPSLVPATGTPAPGGLGWAEVNELLRRVIASRRVVGFDVVELCPQPGAHASDMLAARLVQRVMSMLVARDASG